jgi:hypothetical protein
MVPEAPSVFQRLISLGSFDEKGSRDGDGEADGIRTRHMLRMEHQVVFEQWLWLNLGDKLADLEACAETQDRTAIDIVRHGVQPRFHKNLIPETALGPQRELFDIEMEILWPCVIGSLLSNTARLPPLPTDNCAWRGRCDSQHRQGPFRQMAFLLGHFLMRN